MTAAATPAASGRPRRRALGDWMPAVAAVLFWIVLPVICLLAIGVGVDRLVSHINHVPGGVRGDFVVTTHNCQQELCITGGTFISDDKSVVERDLLGVYRWTLGTKHRVVYNADSADVIPLPAHWDPTEAVLGLTGAAALLGLWGWCLRSAVRRARARAFGGPPEIE